MTTEAPRHRHLISRLQTWFPFVFAFLRSEQVLMLVYAAVIGVLAAYGAIAFRAMIEGAGWLFFGGAYASAFAISQLPWFMRIFLPALGGLIISPIVVRWAPEARGSGIPEVIESVALHGGAVRKRVVPLKAVAAALTLGAGMSAGREGPIVHIGAAIGSWLAQTLRLSVKQMRTLVGCGVAGGIAATFNTPFAGALFAVEVVLGDFGTAKISPIVIASVVATVISRYYTDEFVQIVVPPFHDDVTLVSVLPFFLLGIACAIVSVAFIRALKYGWLWSEKWPWSPYLLPALGGLIVGVLGFFRPEVYGVGYDTINAVLEGNVGLWLLVAILLAKLAATAATLTTGGSGGVFAPSLFMGALTGSIAGAVTHLINPGIPISPAAFALVGMGAMVAGTTRAPISAVLIIFEMTRDYGTIVPLMAACIPSVLLSAALQKDSIYIAKLTHRGVSLKPQGEVNLLRGQRVGDIMNDRIERVRPGTPLAEMIEVFFGTRYPIVWMTDEKGKLLGVIHSRNFQQALAHQDTLLDLVVAQDLSVSVTNRLHPDDDLGFVARMMDDIQADILPVVDRETGIMQGDLMRGDIIETYNRELALRDSLRTTVDAIHVAERLGMVDLGNGYAIVEFEVPLHMRGKTLAELDLRRKANAQVLMIRRKGQRTIPGPDTKLEDGDVLFVAGDAAELEKKLR